MLDVKQLIETKNLSLKKMIVLLIQIDLNVITLTHSDWLYFIEKFKLDRDPINEVVKKCSKLRVHKFWEVLYTSRSDLHSQSFTKNKFQELNDELKHIVLLRRDCLKTEILLQMYSTVENDNFVLKHVILEKINV